MTSHVEAVLVSGVRHLAKL